MEELNVFQQLKRDVLIQYKEHHPYFEGNWKTFSSQDIKNLIDLISESINENISEKWIYTHLKPEDNKKLPRKDMLDILSKFVGYTGWDEYIFKNREVSLKSIGEEKSNSRTKKFIFFFLGFILIAVIVYYKFFSNNLKVIKVEEKYTNEALKNDVEVLIVKDSNEVPVKIVNSKIEIPADEDTKVKFKSPFYKEKIVNVNSSSNQKVQLELNDYAMILKGFMKADIKDWQTRKEQLNIILDDNLEVLVMLNNNLGAEYFNKEEFIELVTVPSASLKKMKIIELKSNEKTDKINFIRILQE